MKMISIDKTTVEKPSVLDNNTIQSRLLKIKNKEKPGKEINNLYNDKDVRATLNELYNNKCAYCEGITNTAKFTSRIDHFRPKNGIKSVENHKGYFWLGYEWSNLLPTCEKCNIKKSNEFPLLEEESTRISDNLEVEGFLENNNFNFDNFNIKKLEKENRLLLNPEIDKVEEHLYFSPTGEIKYLTDKGEKSIEVYDLNRNSLILERRSIIDDIIQEVIDIFSNYQQHSDLLMKFFNDKIAYTEENEYSFFRFFIKHFFNSFVISDLDNLQFTDISKILTNEYEKHSLNK
jgi:uncharacterized protein (TIGR02646 family)